MTRDDIPLRMSTRNFTLFVIKVIFTLKFNSTITVVQRTLYLSKFHKPPKTNQTMDEYYFYEGFVLYAVRAT